MDEERGCRRGIGREEEGETVVGMQYMREEYIKIFFLKTMTTTIIADLRVE